ncbi:unnamed protein product [Lactuca saligna]|uniref:DUF4283 domain-containing protein n=1 Tax=Lactuca saligna TaxID=75948 RepID=A0AA36E780_LACSI|nr:unnamed protein product [Lactuca saligna]
MKVRAFIEVEGYPKIVMRYLGGLKMLVEFETITEKEQVLTEDERIWKPQFKELYQWDPKENFTERIASILIFGVPQHAWCEEVFLTITKSWGKVIILDECPTENINMAYGRVGILTSYLGFISESSSIVVDKVKYGIIVMEDILESNKLSPVIASNDLITSPTRNMWEQFYDPIKEEDEDEEGISNSDVEGCNWSPKSAPSKLR